MAEAIDPGVEPQLGPAVVPKSLVVASVDGRYIPVVDSVVVVQSAAVVGVTVLKLVATELVTHSVAVVKGVVVSVTVVVGEVSKMYFVTSFHPVVRADSIVVPSGGGATVVVEKTRSIALLCGLNP
jgi:hypothetical protein